MPFDYSALDEKAAAGLKRWADHLALWRLCDKAACRRLHGCCGEVRSCFPARFELLPDGVRDWFLALMYARSLKMTFDEVMEEIAGTEAQHAFAQWHDAAERAARRRAVR